MLVHKKRIELTPSCQSWVARSLLLPGISLIPLSPSISIASCELPGEFHGDSADRIIVASAKIENLCIISRDQKLSKYCLKNNIPLIKG